jgi:hypothetical protein
VGVACKILLLGFAVHNCCSPDHIMAASLSAAINGLAKGNIFETCWLYNYVIFK